MGNTFTAQTGYQPGDPAAWWAATDYALDAAKERLGRLVRRPQRGGHRAPGHRRRPRPGPRADRSPARSRGPPTSWPSPPPQEALRRPQAPPRPVAGSRGPPTCCGSPRGLQRLLTGADGGTVWPVAGQTLGEVNNPFGAGQARAAGTSVPLPSKNVGADLRGEYGATVVAPVCGTVVEVFDAPDERDENANHGWGGMTLLRGDNGYIYRLTHAQPGSVRSRPGQRVEHGQRLQEVGLSGNTTGAHLDVEKFDAPGRFVDPSPRRGGRSGGRISRADRRGLGGRPATQRGSDVDGADLRRQPLQPLQGLVGPAAGHPRRRPRGPDPQAAPVTAPEPAAPAPAAPVEVAPAAPVVPAEPAKPPTTLEEFQTQLAEAREALAAADELAKDENQPPDIRTRATARRSPCGAGSPPSCPRSPRRTTASATRPPPPRRRRRPRRRRSGWRPRRTPRSRTAPPTGTCGGRRRDHAPQRAHRAGRVHRDLRERGLEVPARHRQGGHRLRLRPPGAGRDAQRGHGRPGHLLDPEPRTGKATALPGTEAAAKTITDPDGNVYLQNPDGTQARSCSTPPPRPSPTTGG